MVHRRLTVAGPRATTPRRSVRARLLSIPSQPAWPARVRSYERLTTRGERRAVQRVVKGVLSGVRLVPLTQVWRWGGVGVAHGFVRQHPSADERADPR